MRRAKTGYVCMYTSINIVSMCITFRGSPRGHAAGWGALSTNRIFWGMSRVLKHTSLTYKTFYRYIMRLYVCLVLYVWGIHTYALEGFKHTYIHAKHTYILAWGLLTYIHTCSKAFREVALSDKSLVLSLYVCLRHTYVNASSLETYIHNTSYLEVFSAIHTYTCSGIPSNIHTYTYESFKHTYINA